MKIKSIKARKEATSTVMTLSGFVIPEREYRVEERRIAGKKAIIIHESEMAICSECGAEYLECNLIGGGICDECLSSI